MSVDQDGRHDRPPAEIVTVDGERRLRCPYCGSDGVDPASCRLPERMQHAELGFWHVEDVQVYRHVGRIDDTMQGQDSQTEQPGPLGVLAVESQI